MNGLSSENDRRPVLTEWTGTVLRMTLDSANHVNALDAAMTNEWTR